MRARAEQRRAMAMPAACFLAAAVAAASPREIGLQEAIDCALHQNRDLKALAISVEAQRFGLSSAEADFKLTLTPEGNAEASDRRRVTGLGAAVSKKTEWGTSLGLSGRTERDDADGGGDGYLSVVRVSLQQPLLRNAGRLVTREPLVQAEELVTGARRALEGGKADLVLSVVESHEDLLRLQRQLERSRQAAERLKRFARLTAVRERQGQATHIDTLRAELRFGDARLQLSSAEQQVLNRRREYADLLGFSPEEVLEALPAPRLVVTATNVEEAVAGALSNRLDYAQTLQDRDDASRGLMIARRGLLPDLNLLSRYERNGAGPSWSEARHLDDDGWVVGLALSADLPLRRERAAFGQAELNTETMALKVESLRFAISRQVRDALQNYQRSEEQVPIAQGNFEAARKRARLARRLFELGKGDSLSVADAEDELRDAEVGWLNAQASASVAAYRLLHVAGTLVEFSADLKPRVP